MQGGGVVGNLFCQEQKGVERKTTVHGSSKDDIDLGENHKPDERKVGGKGGLKRIGCGPSGLKGRRN